jgi:ATP-dependent RNA helicase RhlE
LTFDELGLSETLLEGLDAMGFEKATPVQEKAIPIIINGKDLIACAQTGTGKTAAFLLPILDDLSKNPTDSVHSLILCPTRELAVQIERAIEGFAYFTGANCLAIYGGRDGTSFETEKRALTMGANIVVATPGRLIAHLNLGYVKMDSLKNLILDEADRMLDMGFIHDLRKIVSFLPDDRQTLMFSATMPPKIRSFAKLILREPEQISFAVSKPAEGILQAVYEVEDEQKLPLLEMLLGKRKEKEDRVIIFASTKVKVIEITQLLKRSGLNADEIHSNLDQDKREEILRKFRSAKVNILVATDILSRGIDVKGINLVVNYDVPSDGEDYVHRIGRTARAEADGVAITLVNRKDRRKIKNIEDLIEAKIRRMPVPPAIQEIPVNTSRSSHSGGGRGKGGRGGSKGKGRGRSSDSRKNRRHS